MRRTLTTTLIGAALALPGGAQPAPGTLEGLFPRQAPLTVDGEGLARVLVPPPVLAECRPDLSDVRILDSAGKEVPYLVDSGVPPESVLEIEESLVLEVRNVSRATVEREDAANVQREIYRLGIPYDLPAGGGWELVVTTRRARFVSRVSVSQGDAELIRGESVFRLSQPGVTKTRLVLPTITNEDLTVELEGEEDFFLEPVFRLKHGRTLPGRERVHVELVVVGVEHFEDHSEIEVERPSGLVPDLLVLDSAMPVFSRRVDVWDEGAASVASAVGSGTLFRVDEAAGVERLELDLGVVQGDRLRVVIDNGDSPPLEEVTLAAAIRQPALIFPSIPSGRLLFGGARAHRPRYDLASLRPRLPAVGEAAEVGERLYDPDLLAVGRLGAIADNPEFEPTPALSFAMRPGSALDVRRYAHRQRLSAEPSAEGLVGVDLELDLLAAARADLADVRIVDGEGRQRAYLIERRAAVEVRNLDLRGPETENGVSRYEVELPVESAELDELVLHTPVPYFDRPFHLEGEAMDGKLRMVARGGRLARRQGDPRPLRIAVGGERVTSLELVVSDGDDAPLEITRVEGRFPVPRVYFAAAAGSYEIVTGDPTAEEPVYELARVRDVVLAVSAGSATIEPLEDNPEFSVSARLTGGGGLQSVLLWAAIVLAVVVLAWITLRLARWEES
jgi:hypothetical protein